MTAVLTSRAACAGSRDKITKFAPSSCHKTAKGGVRTLFSLNKHRILDSH